MNGYVDPPGGVDAYRRVIELERDDATGGDSPVAVSDPATLRRLLLEIVRSHSAPRDSPRNTHDREIPPLPGV
ncbi:hypothetical protein NVV99_11555 [Rhodococcus sp. PAE-6]|uniref:hypothetical protein n=1 Tax=Rhodococcus TaxID=1827 RepID=UPI0018D31E80|nr:MULTISPECIES: hypothetical protein [Rhodococcus]MCT7291580.1 hypothetical protein [Rhodococcus sp. PAE-6]